MLTYKCDSSPFCDFAFMGNPIVHIIHHPVVQERLLRLRIVAIGLARDFWKDGPYDGPAWFKRLVTLFPKKDRTPPPAQPAADKMKEAGAAEYVAEAETVAEKVERVPQPWTSDRVGILEAIWGEGCSMPGGDEYADSLSSPLGLNQEMSILDLSAGMGHLARRIADEYKCYVTGMDTDASLAARGMVMSIASGLSKKASIIQYDPATFTASRKYDCIFARELFYRVVGKEKFFKAIDGSLKNGGGQIVFTDFVLDPISRDKPEVLAWLNREKSAAPMTQLEQIKTWKSMGYDLRVAEDQTHQYKNYIVVGLANLASFMRYNIPDIETKPILVREIDLLSKRLAAFHAGLKYYRFYGIKY